MRALVLEAEWAPRGGLNKDAPGGRLISGNGSLAWRNPRLHLTEVEPPTPGPGEVLIRVALCGVCGTDVHCREVDTRGFVRFSGPMALPVVMGHEFSGEVVALGEGVRTLKVGEPIAAESILWCGVCEPCRRGSPNQCAEVELLGLTRDGAFAEYITLPERLCWSLRPLLDAGIERRRALGLGALLEPLGCAYNGLFIEGGGLLPGAHIAIHGAGPIGLGALMLARAAGAARVWVVEPDAKRRELALSLGADGTLSPGNEAGGSAEWLLGLTKGRGVDVQVEAAGAHGPILPECQRALAPGGKVIYLGRGPGEGVLDLNGLVSGAHRVIGARGHAGGGIFPHLLRLMAADKLPLWSMVEATRPFAGVIEAIDWVRNERCGKVLIDVGEGGMAP